MKPLSCRGSIIAGGATSAEGVLQQDDALNKMRSIACPPLAVSPHCLETLTPSPFDDATKHMHVCQKTSSYLFQGEKIKNHQ
jgi:peptidase E